MPGCNSLWGLDNTTSALGGEGGERMLCVSLFLTGPGFKFLLYQISVASLNAVIIFQGARVLEAITIRFKWPMVHLRTKYGEAAMSCNLTIFFFSPLICINS